MKNNTKASLGAAAAATGAAAIAAYYLYGARDAKQNRATLAGWAKSAEREVVQRAKQLKQAALTDETMKTIIGEVARRYEMTKKLDPRDVRAFVSSMQKSFKEARSSVVRNAKAGASSRAAKMNTKKTTKKTTAKKVAKRPARKSASAA